AGAAEVLVQNSDRVIADDVLRPGNGKSGDGNAARQRLELHDAERVGAARKHEHVRRREMAGKNAVLQSAKKFGIGKAAFELRLLRAGADDNPGAGQIERKESFQVLFDGDAAHRHEDRTGKGKIDGAIGVEQIDVDAAGPHAEIAES